MGFKRKKMRTLTLHIELFALQRLLFRFYNLLCRTARCAQRSVPDLNLIRTNIFMFKVLRKNNFSSNHSTSKNFITKIQNYLKMSSEKEVAYIPPTFRWVGFTLHHIKLLINLTYQLTSSSYNQLIDRITQKINKFIMCCIRKTTHL